MHCFEVVLSAVVLLLVAVGAVWAHVRYWRARLTVRMDYALEERIGTPDGAAIELRRLPHGALRSAPALRSGLPPVLMVHGLAANHRNLDLSPD